MWKSSVLFNIEVIENDDDVVLDGEVWGGF